MIFCYQLISSIINNNRIIKRVKSTPYLNKKAPPGSYVKFNGILSYPQTQTLHNKINCGYWRVDIRGVFETKQKKPAKGWETHRPSIFNDSMHDQPMILYKGDDVVHVEFHPKTHVMQDMMYKHTTQKKCPTHFGKQICNPKYTQYMIEESWYPVNQMLTVMGKLVAVDNCTYTITENHQEDQPPMVARGNIKAFIKRHARRVSRAIITLIVMLIVYLFFTFVLQASGLSWVVNLVLGIIILITWHKVYEAGVISA